MACEHSTILPQARAGYDSAKGAAAGAAASTQDTASEYAAAGQEQVKNARKQDLRFYDYRFGRDICIVQPESG